VQWLKPEIPGLLSWFWRFSVLGFLLLGFLNVTSREVCNLNVSFVALVNRSLFIILKTFIAILPLSWKVLGSGCSDGLERSVHNFSFSRQFVRGQSEYASKHIQHPPVQFTVQHELHDLFWATVIFALRTFLNVRLFWHESGLCDCKLWIFFFPARKYIYL